MQLPAHTLANATPSLTLKKGDAGRCIYTQPSGLCDGNQPLHQKEHYLPAALGNFRNDIRLADFICTGCQAKFGRHEDVFIHNGPEAFFRNMIGRKGRKKHRKKNIFREPTAGMPPLRVIAQAPGEDFTDLWEMDSTSEGHPLKQLVFRDEQSLDIHLPFVPGRLAKDFENFRKEHKGKRLRLITYFYDTGNPAEEQEIEQTCSDFLRGTRSEPQIVSEGGNVLAQMRAAISLPYLQAIAKIAFHFVLAHFPFSGLEPQFDGIKRFIFTGTDSDRFVQMADEPFLALLKNPNVVLNRWSHLLSAENDGNTIEARMQFFAGPKLRPIVWRVMLGPSLSGVHATYGKGFIYYYFEAPDDAGYTGAMMPLQRFDRT